MKIFYFCIALIENSSCCFAGVVEDLKGKRSITSSHLLITELSHDTFRGYCHPVLVFILFNTFDVRICYQHVSVMLSLYEVHHFCFG